MDSPRLDSFYSLMSPILAECPDGKLPPVYVKRVVLAFAIDLDGLLVCMTVGLGGGTILWVSADLVDWPAPIQAMPAGQRVERKLT